MRKSNHSNLFPVEHQSLQVFAFGMVDVDGVIGRLVQLVQDAYLAACLGGSSEDGIAEMVLRDYLRTGEREQNASLSDSLESLVVQTCIALQRIVQCPAVLGKSRWVKDNQVVRLSVEG